MTVKFTPRQAKDKNASLGEVMWNLRNKSGSTLGPRRLRQHQQRCSEGSHLMRETRSQAGHRRSLTQAAASIHLSIQQKCTKPLHCTWLRRVRLNTFLLPFSTPPSFSICLTRLSFLWNNIGINVYLHSLGVRPHPLATPLKPPARHQPETGLTPN